MEKTNEINLSDMYALELSRIILFIVFVIGLFVATIPTIITAVIALFLPGLFILPLFFFFKSIFSLFSS